MTSFNLISTSSPDSRINVYMSLFLGTAPSGSIQSKFLVSLSDVMVSLTSPVLLLVSFIPFIFLPSGVNNGIRVVVINLPCVDFFAMNGPGLIP